MRLSEAHVALTMAGMLMSVMQSTVEGNPSQFTKACNLMLAFVHKTRPALAAMIVYEIVNAGTDSKEQMVLDLLRHAVYYAYCSQSSTHISAH